MTARRCSPPTCSRRCRPTPSSPSRTWRPERHHHLRLDGRQRRDANRVGRDHGELMRALRGLVGSPPSSSAARSRPPAWSGSAAPASTSCRPRPGRCRRTTPSNPGMLWVLRGRAALAAAGGQGEVACAGCHGDAAGRMRGVAARYPAFDERRGGPSTSPGASTAAAHDGTGAAAGAESRTNCWRSPPMSPTSRAACRSRRRATRGCAVPRDGRRLFEHRMGQLDLSCAACHDGMGQAARRQPHPPGASDRLSALPPGVAGAWAPCSAACATA